MGAALGAGRRQRRSILGRHGHRRSLQLVNEVARVLPQGGHECLALQLALLDQCEPVLPLASGLCRGQKPRTTPSQQVDEAACLLRGGQVALRPEEIGLLRASIALPVVEQSLDGRSACRRRPEALVLHGRALLLIVDELSRRLHGSEQSGFGVAQGRGCLASNQLEVLYVRNLAVAECAERRLARMDRFPVVTKLVQDLKPSGALEHAALADERLTGDQRCAHGVDELRRGEKCRDEASGHQFVDALLIVRELIRDHSGWNNCEVVADLGVVEDPLVEPDHASAQRLLGQMSPWGGPQSFHGRFCGIQVVLGQRAAVRARIGRHLVALVQALSDVQRLLHGKLEALVGLPLQGREVKQPWRMLCSRLYHLIDLLDWATCALGQQGLGGPFVEEPRTIVLAGGFVARRFLRGVARRCDTPLALVRACARAEGAHKLPKVTCFELRYLPLAVHHQGQRWRLHAPRRGGLTDATLELPGAHHCTAGIDADQPVGFASAARRGRKVVQRCTRSCGVKGVAQRVLGHRLAPHALHRLSTVRLFEDQAEDELPFAAGVAGVQHRGDILPPHEAGNHIELRLCLLDHPKVEPFWQEGEARKSPRCF